MRDYPAEFAPVFARLKKVRALRKAGEWKCLCPAHDDKNASLSVVHNQARGFLLVKCHANAGCTFDAIAASLGMTRADFRTDTRDPIGGRAMKPKAGELVCAYPYEDFDGTVLYETVRFANPKDFRQRRPHPQRAGQHIWNLEGVKRVLYRLPRVHAALEAKPDRPVFVCYTPDTEILTRRGWVYFPDLRDDDWVAQYELGTGEITFCRPAALQEIPYGSGDLVHVSADWCDLVVTPDHRQPVRFGDCTPKIVAAADVYASHRLPTAGVIRNESGCAPTEAVARLVAAWQADGVRAASAGHTRVSWNLKKERKKKRIRQLLAAAGVEWEEKNYPSTPGWTTFLVPIEQLTEVFRHCPDKKIPRSATGWSFEARSALIDEVQHWDGDSVGKSAVRFFTGDKDSADALQEVAVVTGWSSNARPDERVGKKTSWVVNLQHKTWRQLGRTPERGKRDAVEKVYCCTVETGLLVVRRNGKVVISGNCEGEKSVDNWHEKMGVIVTTNVGGAGKWLPEYTEYLRGRTVYVLGDFDKIDPLTGRRPGEDHVRKVCNSLHGVAKAVKGVLAMPGLVEGQDPDDWLNGMWDKADPRGSQKRAFAALGEVIEATKPWVPVPEVRDDVAPFARGVRSTVDATRAALVDVHDTDHALGKVTRAFKRVEYVLVHKPDDLQVLGRALMHLGAAAQLAGEDLGAVPAAELPAAPPPAAVPEPAPPPAAPQPEPAPAAHAPGANGTQKAQKARK